MKTDRVAMNSDQKLPKRYQEQIRDTLHPHQTKIWKDIIIPFSKKYLMMKKFLVMKINPQQWKKILAGATFVQFFPSNQLLKEQDIKACSIADKNKELVENGSFAVPLQVAKWVLHHSHPWADIKPPNVIVQEIRRNSCRRSAINATISDMLQQVKAVLLLFKIVMIWINYKRFGFVAAFINIRLTCVSIIEYFQKNTLNFKLGKRFTIFKYKIKQPYFI